MCHCHRMCGKERFLFEETLAIDVSGPPIKPTATHVWIVECITIDLILQRMPLWDILLPFCYRRVLLKLKTMKKLSNLQFLKSVSVSD